MKVAMVHVPVCEVFSCTDTLEVVGLRRRSWVQTPLVLNLRELHTAAFLSRLRPQELTWDVLAFNLNHLAQPCLAQPCLAQLCLAQLCLLQLGAHLHAPTWGGTRKQPWSWQVHDGRTWSDSFKEELPLNVTEKCYGATWINCKLASSRQFPSADSQQRLQETHVWTFSFVSPLCKKVCP